MTQFSDIIVTPTYGPISTNQYPNAMAAHNSGVLVGKSPNPPLFYPSQEPAATDQNVNSRHQYFRTAESARSLAIQRARAIEKVTRNFSFNELGLALNVQDLVVAPRRLKRVLFTMTAYAMEELARLVLSLDRITKFL